MAISNMQQARQLRAGGGIMALEPRQGFFLGKLAKKITDINNISEEDFILENYNHYPTIKADMIA